MQQHWKKIFCCSLQMDSHYIVGTVICITSSILFHQWIHMKLTAVGIAIHAAYIVSVMHEDTHI